MKTLFIKYKILFSLVFLFGINQQVNAQNYYWIGGTGDWTDTGHWSNLSGGGSGSIIYSTPPSEGANVIFDTNSFLTATDTVYFNISSSKITSMKWTNSSNGSTFTPCFHSSASDSLFIKKSLTLDANMDYAFSGTYYFTDSENDSIKTAGKTFLNDIHISNFDDTLFLLDDFTSTGGIYYNLGGFNIDNRTLNVAFFHSNKSTDRQLFTNNTTFHLTGSDTVLYNESFGLTKFGSNEVFYIDYVGPDTVEISMGDNSFLWNELQINSQITQFVSPAYFSTINAVSVSKLLLDDDIELRSPNFNLSGSCGQYLEIEKTGINPGVFNNDGTPMTIDYCKISGMKGFSASGYSATNSIDLGNNTNFVILEDLTSTNYFWVGGNGNFYDPTHWALTSGGAADACIPGPNDAIFFDANSGSPTTITLQENVIVGTADFSGITSSLTLTGQQETFTTRVKLSGSSFLDFNWTGVFELNSIGTISIQSNGTLWKNDFITVGSGTKSLLDNFQSEKNINHVGGTFTTAGFNLTLFSLLADQGTGIRNIDFSGSIVTINGDNWGLSNPAMVGTFTSTNSHLIFANSENAFVTFKAGNYTYDTVSVNTSNIQFLSTTTNMSVFNVQSGSSVIFDNSSNHYFDSINANGSCIAPILLKSSSANGPAATLHRNGNVTTFLSSLILDHIDVNTIGNYVVFEPTFLNGPQNWIAASDTNSVVVNFVPTGGGNTAIGASTLTSTKTLTYPTTPSAILSSEINFPDMTTTGTHDLDTFTYYLHGISSPTAAPYAPYDSLPGPSGIVSGLIFNIPTTFTTTDGDVVLQLSNKNNGSGSVRISNISLVVRYAEGYTPPAPTTYYWHGGGGNWSDINHWSLNSGNIPAAPATCLPNFTDNVIFDDLSFSTANDSVVVDKESYINDITWTNSVLDAAFIVDKNLTTFGDVTLQPNLSVSRTNKNARFVFQPIAKTIAFDPNSAMIDVPVVLLASDSLGIMDLQSDLITTDSAIVIIGGGKLLTNNNDLRTGTLYIGSTNEKSLHLGSSNIKLHYGFQEDLTSTNLFIHPGTSSIEIDYITSDTVYDNYFISNGHSFYDVSLNFNSSIYSPLTGTNTFHDFKVGKGSKIKVEAGSVQTVTDSIVMIGNCVDSIYFESDNGASNFTFHNTLGPVQVECLYLKNALTTGQTITALFSTDGGNSSSWTFDNTASVTAGISSISSFCFGDTLQFTNASTAYYGTPTLEWEFDDSETHIGDTSQHYYAIAEEYTIRLMAESANFCRDTLDTLVTILNPAVILNTNISDTTICQGEEAEFYSFAQPDTLITYQYMINGVAFNPIPAVEYDTLISTTLNHLDTILVKIDQEGCLATSNAFVFNVNARPTTTINSNVGATICQGDTVKLHATGGDVYQLYKNGVAITPYGTDTITLSNINHLDTFYFKGRFNATLCTEVSPNMIFTVNALPSVSLIDDDAASNTICVGDVVTWTATSATATSYTYLFNNTAQTTLPSNTWSSTSLAQSDIVTVTVEDAFGCISPASNALLYNVNVIPTPTLVADFSTICEGDPVTFTGSGVSNYTFLVNSAIVAGPSGANFYSTSTLTDSDTIQIFGTLNNCPGYSNNIVMAATATPTTSLTSTLGDTICAGENPVYTATSSSATSFEFFLNGNSQGAAGVSNTYTPSAPLANGNIVSVKGYLAGCEAFDQISVVVNPNPNPTIYTDNSSDTICQNDLLTITGTGGTTYDFFVNGINQGVSTNVLSTDTLVAGSNATWVVANNSFNCSASSDTLDLFVVDLPNVNLSSNAAANTICAGSPITITASAGADEYQFFLNSNSLGLPSTNNIFTSASLNDGDTITVVAFNNGCPKIGLDTILVNVNSNPTATLSGTSIFCAGNNQIFTAGTGTDYEFFLNTVSQGTPSAVNTFDGGSLAPGNYNLQVSVLDNTCAATASINLTVLTTPTVSLSGNNTICSGENAIFQATGGSTYEFFVNGTSVGTSSTYATNALVNGDVISVVGQSLAGCFSTNTAQIAMTINTTPTVTLVSDDADGILCQGQNVLFTGSGANLYEFFIEGNSTGAASATNTFSTVGLTNGQTVSVSGTTNGCTNTDALAAFTVVNYPVVGLTNAADSSLCTGDLTQLIATGANDYLFYINGTPQGAFGPTATFNSTVANGDIVTVEGMTNTCISSANTNIQYSVFTYPTSSLTSTAVNNEICLGDAVTFNSSGASSYAFTIDNLPVGNGTSSFTTSDLTDGQIIQLTASNEGCSTTPPSIVMNVNTMDLTSIVSPSNYMICEGDDVTFQMNGADQYEAFVNGISQGAQSATSTFTLSNLSDLDLITFNGYSNTTGCTQLDDESTYIHVSSTPTVAFNQNTTICEGDSTILSSNSTYGNQWLLDGTPIPNATDTSLVVFNSGDYTLAITKGGNNNLWSKGYNGNGEIGNGTNFNTSIPVEALNLNSIETIASGLNHTMAILQNGNLYTWGSNLSGQLGNGTYTSNNSPVFISSLPGIIDVDGGDKFTLAVSSTGNLFAWGKNNFGQLGLANTTVYNSPQLVASQTNVKAVATGVDHSIILKNDSTVWTTGNNDFGQLGTGNLISTSTFTQVAGLSGIVSIEAGEYHSMAIDAQGTLYVWGNNGNGQLGLSDLTNRTSPTSSPLKKVAQVSGGNSHTIALSETGSVYTMGANAFGQLGTNNVQNQVTPKRVPQLNAVQSISAGQYISLILKKDGTVFGAGRNNENAINASSALIIDSFEIISNLDGVTAINGARGLSHFIFGNEKECVSPTLPMTVNQAPLPVLFYTNGDLSTTVTNVTTYEWFFNGVPILNSNVSTWTPINDGYYTVLVTYTSGCSRLSAQYAFGITGTDEIENGISTTVYPNPTDGQVNILWNREGYYQTYTVLDITGRIVLQGDINSDIDRLQIDIFNQSSGLYKLILTGVDGRNYNQKLIKL